jgi:Rad3-related DNA helicase
MPKQLLLKLGDEMVQDETQLSNLTAEFRENHPLLVKYSNEILSVIKEALTEVQRILTMIANLLQFSQSPREALPTQSVQQTQNQGQTSIGCYRSPIVWSKNAAKAILRDFCVKCVVPPVVPGLSNKFEISLN